MGRKSDDVRLDEIRAYLQEHPEEKPGTIASKIGIDNKTMMRALTQFEERGDLLQEDDHGRISWFGWRK